MATRPAFLPGNISRQPVLVRDVAFTWHPGLAPSQKRKCIASLHSGLVAGGLAADPLEISTKSPEDAGIRLSAFNLRFSGIGWPGCVVEVAFQSSKVFERGGPYRDLAAASPAEAKRDSRLRGSGGLVAFEFQGERWGLLPRTMFYDWIYINALVQNPDLAEVVLRHDAFTDIEFNPERSVNCQAHSAALFVALHRADAVADALAGPDRFRAAVGRHATDATQQQVRLL